jgi:tetratricopeptide (TPR) repeat protein
MSEPNAILHQVLGQHRAGALQSACDRYRQVLAARPADPDALHLFGVARAAMGDHANGIALIRQAIGIRPNFPAAHFHLGILLLDQGQADAALTSLNACVRQCPSHVPALAASGHALQALGRPDEAIAAFTAVLEIHPENVEMLTARAGVLRTLGRVEAAVRDLDHAVSRQPGHVPALMARAEVALDQLQYASALGLYDRVLTRHPEHLAGLLNRGATQLAMGRPDQALATWRQALVHHPDHPDVTLNIGLCLLQMGDWQGGWAAHEARLRRPPWTEALKTATVPQWDGHADLTGRRLLLVSEQGLGDTVQFSRFARLATARGATVILGVEPPLRRLMTTLAGVAQIVGPDDPGPDPGPDLFCPLMSLPARLALTLHDAAMSAPYLRADPDSVAYWRARLATLPGRKVGLAWAGDPRPGDPVAVRLDRRRSITLDRLAPLLAVPGASFVSLQKGVASAQAAGRPIVNWTAELDDFAATAALIEALDLVITVDTSVAHVAGAQGRPVWVLNRFDRCWRWMTSRTDTIWYPTMRLFTQGSPGVWDDVVSAVAAELAMPWSASGSVQAS